MRAVDRPDRPDRPGLWARWQQRLSARLHDNRALYVIQVLLLSFTAVLLSQFSMSYWPVRIMSLVLCALLLLLLLAFVRGLSVNRVVFIGGSMGAVYLCLSALVEGGVLSSTLVWLPLLAVAIFYVVRPRTGRAWMAAMMLLILGMAAISWHWGQALPLPGVAELSALSLSDSLFATVAFLLVPYFYQQAVDKQIQELRTRQAELKARYAEMAQAVQMREQFIASVSHELRTPMNAILGLNALLLDAEPDKPRARQVLEYTRQSADHLMTVINDVLDYSQFSSGQLRAQPEVFELAHTVHAAFDMFRPRVEGLPIQYSCRIDPEVPTWVCTDRHRLVQVLVNLLANAIKFTHQGSVDLHVRVSGQGVAFSVQDTGIGMTPEQQASIFLPYGQAHARIQSQYGGNGLGLTISQKLVQILGGHMGVESRIGQGSRFWFWLPLQAVAGISAEPPAPSPPIHEAWLPRRFLVVDDHPVNRLLVQQVLLRYWPGCQVHECEDGAQALAWLHQAGGCDLVLMDMVMPVMDGIEVTRQIRASSDGAIRQVPVLGLTANVNPQDLQRFEAAGLNGVLLKPFDIAQLHSEIRRLLQV